MEKDYYDEMVSTLQKLKKDGTIQKNTVVLFGHCEAAEKMLDVLLDWNIPVWGIADNNQSKWGGAYRGITIGPPRQIFQGLKAEQTVILMTTRAFSPIKKQLLEMGYPRIYKIVDYNTFSDFSLSKEAFFDKAERVRQGYRVYAELRKQFGQALFLICPFNALGDTYMALSYFPAYQKKKGIKEYVAIVQGNGCRQVAGLFHTQKVVCLERKEMEAFLQAVIFVNADNVLIAHHNLPYTNDSIRISDFKNVTFREHYHTGVYGLGEKAVQACPNKGGRTVFPELAKGRSAILAPRAKSMVELPEAYWEARVQELKEQGYAVFTNVAEGEAPIAGTHAVAYPLQDLIRAAEYAGLFISMRSGLCEILSTAECEKEFLYPDCMYSSTHMTVKEFFEI